VIRQANNIPPQMRLKAGSTILVPKTSASTGSDIAESIIDNAQVAFEADRGDSKHKGGKLSGVQRIKATAAHAVAEIKSRVSGGNKASASVHGRKRR
jgi:membrane-bound lytic murein transglycosylase D